MLDAQILDPGKGAFCAVDKAGRGMAMPPESREPIQDREHNPRGVRRINKSAQDRMPRDSRPRKQMNDRQREWIRARKPVRSADYGRLPR